MNDTLLIFTLSIQSSYLKNLEQPAGESFDTLQFYVHNNAIWRIRTFALDHDIQIYPINLRGKTIPEALEFLTTSTKEHYGDVVAREVTLKLENPGDKKTAEAFFTKKDMHPELVTSEEFAYWNPDGGTYTNQSKPL